MKKLTFVLLLLCLPLLAQDYINVENGSITRDALLDDISKITFSSDGSTINFEMTDGGTATEQLDDIVKIYFGVSQGDQSLPVALVSFTAVKSGDNVTLTWETASEVNNRGFDIERCLDETAIWRKITFIKGNGNSSTSTEYSYIDKNITSISNLKYRLKQMDYDGSFEYSEEISVTVESSALPEKFALENNYPNPFNPTTTISYQIPKEGLTTMLVFDMCGRVVTRLVNEQQTPGYYQVTFDASELGSGVYFCKLNSGNYTRTIKMLLVK